MSTLAPEPSSVQRFDLAIQRNHLMVFTLALLSALGGHAAGVFPMRIGFAVGLWACACVCTLALRALYRRGFDRRFLNPIWMTNDILFVTFGVYATGGVISPCFVWYAATASAAAFAGGRKAAWAASVANTVAYITLLVVMGQADAFNSAMLLALTRMVFVFGASYFFIMGVADLTQKRLRIGLLESEERRKVEELTRISRELADANRRSQEADKLKSQFLANMSHELRTPMNSIIGFSEILVERLQDKVEPKHLGFLEHIHTSGTHLLGIINDVLDLSKIEAGKMEIYPEFFSIAPVIESVCQVMRGMTRVSSTFVVDVPADLPQIETDLAKFKQVLFNLLSNAVKFSPPERPITIRAWLDGGAIHVSVRDEGIGIDPSNHELIFEEFRQVDGTARREFGGTGLGLALVRRFVELQGGKATVESTLDHGSTFTFTLPVRSRAAVVTRLPETSMPLAARVLVVEDDPNAYELIASALGSAGYLPIRARHGDEALRLARESQPAAVTLDLVLPGMDGWELLKRLKNDIATRQLPIVIISMVDNRDLGLALGADDYFVKPVDRARLLEKLREITSRGGGTKRLLVIDDDAAVHALLSEELTGLGFAVDRAFCGEDGLRAAEERAPDVIILDLMMPGMSGFEVAAALKQNVRTADIPILVLTSKEITSEDRAFLHAKAATFVQKGNTAREQLVKEIRRMTTTLTTLALLLALALPMAAQEEPYRVLLPVLFEQPIPGALGSQWKTALAIHNPTASQFHIDWCAGSTIPMFDACPLSLIPTAHLTQGETQGTIPPFSGSEDALNHRGGPRQLYIRSFQLPVGTPSQLSFQLRALDISRSTTNAGTEVPVVRQEQFRTAKTNLLNVPGDANFRLTLRLYELTLKVASFTIRVYDQATNALIGESTVELSFGFEHHHRSMFEPPHVQIGDMTQLVSAGNALPAMMRIEIEPHSAGSEFWGFVSITNNETQHLTLVTPQ